MAIVYQSTSTTTTVSVTNGNELVVRDFVDIYTTSGDGVLLSSGTSQTDLWNYGDIISPVDGVQVIAEDAAVVNFGTISSITNDAIDLATAGRGEDPFGYRAEAIDLMRLAEALSR